MKKEQSITEDSEETKAQFSWRRVLCITAIPFFIFISLITPPIFGAKRASELTHAAHKLKQISIPLFSYEHIHGKYPNHIEDLVSPEVIPQAYLDDCFLRSPKMVGDWWYNVGIADLGISAPPHTPQLISPLIKDKRAILRVDGSVKQLTDAEAIKIITDADSTWKPIMGNHAKD